MPEELTVYDEQPMVFADDSLLAMAEQAERRIEAVIKIKQVALKVTNSTDWVDQNGKPYLQASGAEKIGNLFNISWRINEPLMEPEEDGHYTYTYRGIFSMAGRSIQVEGSRSSKDPFFKQYSYQNNQKTEKTVPERDNKRDVKMAAMTNLLGNGITRLLGIRNLSYEDLAKYAGINKSDIGKVEYKDRGDKKDPGAAVKRSSKSDKKDETGGGIEIAQRRALATMFLKLGLKDVKDQVLTVGTFLKRKIKSIDDLTKAEALQVITALTKDQPKDDDECTKDPKTCAAVGWIDGVAYCGPDQEKCEHQEG